MKRAVWIVVTIVSLGAVVWWATRQHAPKMPTSAVAVGWLVASLAAYGLAIFLRGWRWDRILNLSGIPHERADAFWLIPVAYMGNTVLPLRGGEILRISLLSKRANASVREILPRGIGRLAVRVIIASISASSAILSTPAAPAPAAMLRIAMHPSSGLS